MRKRKGFAHNEEEKGICTQKGREKDLLTQSRNANKKVTTGPQKTLKP
jgi:hypothetical protein